MSKFIKELYPYARAFVFGMLVILCPCLYLIASLATRNASIESQIQLMHSQEKMVQEEINKPILKNSTTVRKTGKPIGINQSVEN